MWTYYRERVILKVVMNKNNKPYHLSNDKIKTYILNERYHREDGPAVEYPNGTNIWYLNGQLHRKDGPAVEMASKTKKWYFNGVLHREDGPAVEWLGDLGKEWWLNGTWYTENSYWQELFKRGLITEKELFLKLL